MEKSKKRTIIQLIICVGLLCLIWGVFFVSIKGVRRNLDIKEDDFSWIYQVDSIVTEGGVVIVRGFAFEDGIEVSDNIYDIVLQDTESGKNYILKMNYTEREDVNEYFLCEYDYVQSGFEASIDAKKLDLNERNYEVLLRPKDRRLAYRTGTYIAKGVLTYANPMTFKPVEAVGTDLAEIVEKGILRVYEPDNRMYVYQYEGNLYSGAGSKGVVSCGQPCQGHRYSSR